MTELTPIMLGSVELRLRLVYETTRVPEAATGDQSGGTGVPGWRLVDLLPEDLTVPPHDAGDESPGACNRSRFATEPISLTLNRDEAEGYYLNLTSPQPSLFVLVRLPDVGAATAAQATAGVPEAEAVTVSYSEAARWMDGGMVVIRTPLPEPMLAWIAEFAQYHFQAEGKKKRGKFRPSFLSRQQFGEVARAEKQGAGTQGTAPDATQPRHGRH